MRRGTLKQLGVDVKCGSKVGNLLHGVDHLHQKRVHLLVIDLHCDWFGRVVNWTQKIQQWGPTKREEEHSVTKNKEGPKRTEC